MSGDTRSVNQTLLKAGALAKGGMHELAVHLYTAVLKKFPKNKSAAEGLKALQTAAPGSSEEISVLISKCSGRIITKVGSEHRWTQIFAA